MVDSSALDARWSPRTTAAWYMRESRVDPSRRELFVINLGVSLDVDAAPVALGEVALDPVWSPDGSWLFFATAAFELEAWSSAQAITTRLAAYPGPPISISPSPDSRGVLVYLPPDSTGQLEARYEFVSARGGGDPRLASRRRVVQSRAKSRDADELWVAEVRPRNSDVCTRAPG